MNRQFGFLAWKGQMEEGFNLVMPQMGYVMRGRQEMPRGYTGLMEDLAVYTPAYKGKNLRMGSFRSDGWCVLIDTMLDQPTLERAARRISVNFKRETIAAMSDEDNAHFYVGYWENGRHVGHVNAKVKEGNVDVEGGLINGHSDPANWSNEDWAEALKAIGVDMAEWKGLDAEEAEFEIIEVRRDYVPEDPVPVQEVKSEKPWWKFWGN